MKSLTTYLQESLNEGLDLNKKIKKSKYAQKFLKFFKKKLGINESWDDVLDSLISDEDSEDEVFVFMAEYMACEMDTFQASTEKPDDKFWTELEKETREIAIDEFGKGKEVLAKIDKFLPICIQLQKEFYKEYGC